MSRIEKVAAAFAVLTLVWFPAGGLAAQDPVNPCPAGDPDEAGLVGTVTDADTGTSLPGATVMITWTGDGGSGEMLAETSAEGVYALCGLMIGSAVTLEARFAETVGPSVQGMLFEALSRVDLQLSFTAREDDNYRLLMCPDFEFPRLILCREAWHLERCQHEYLGRIYATRTGAGVDNQDLIERFVLEAQRVKADAVIEASGEMRGGIATGGSAWTRIEGSAIALVDKDCRG